MKQRLTLFLIFLITGAANLLATHPAEKSPWDTTDPAESYKMWVRCEAGNRTLEKFYSYSSRDELEAADLSSWSRQVLFSETEVSECTLSITVKVRVGWDSNFVEASATVSGIPCDEVVSAIKKLRAQLMAGIQ